MQQQRVDIQNSAQSTPINDKSIPLLYPQYFLPPASKWEQRLERSSLSILQFWPPAQAQNTKHKVEFLFLKDDQVKELIK